jgi:hypothetical protein
MTNSNRCAWPNCLREVEFRTVCSMHYQAAQRNGVDLPPVRELTEFERFELHVDRSAGPLGCHPWTGHCDEDGYGVFKGSIGARAPRYAYRWFVGPLSDKEVVRHKCDNPPCVNPEHLLSGTNADNTRDMLDRGRGLRGSNHHRALINEAMVREIRGRHVPRRVTLRALGAEYGLTETAVHAIITRRTWSHVD